MIYLIQVTLYTAILYMVYLLFLKNRSDHQWSRAYLLLNMVLPFVLPLISMPVFERKSETMAAITLPLITVGTEVSAKANSIGILPVIYIAVGCLLVGYFIAQAVQIVLFIKRHTAEKHDDILLITNTGMGPGSWFRYVFIPTTHTDNAILEHERAHARYKHSYDILLMRLVQCIAWPNVMLFFIAKELKTVHEFQADAVAGTNTETYGTTLLNELFHTKHFSLSHTFAHHPIKRRIMMLQKNKTHAGKTKVVALSLLLVTSMLYVQCSKDVMPAPNATANGPKIEKDADGVYNYAEQGAEFEGDLSAYLMEHITYPKDAQLEKVEGRVVVRFVVDEQGNVTSVKTVNVKKVDERLAKAALDVVSNMPKWKPAMHKGKKVKVYYTLPISYQLNTPETTSGESKG